MLMDKKNTTVAYERANCARTVEYMRCMIEDSHMSERFIQIEESDKNFNESVDMNENREILKNLKVETDENKEEEIQRIVDATHDLSIDEVIGIQKSAGDYEMDAFVEGANTDLMRLNKNHIKSAKKKLKECKKLIKHGEGDRAKKILSDIIEEMKAVKKIIGQMDETSSEKIIGTMIAEWKTLILTIASIVSLFGGIGAGSVLASKSFKYADLAMKLSIGGIAGFYGGILLTCVTSIDEASKINDGITKLIEDGYVHRDKESRDNKAIQQQVNGLKAKYYQIADEVIVLAKRLQKDIDNGDLFKDINK